MMNKKIIKAVSAVFFAAILIMLLASMISFASAYEQKNVFKDWGKAIGTSLTSWVPFIGRDYNVSETSPGDIYGWYKGTTLSLLPWEYEVCSKTFSTQVRNFADNVFNINDLSGSQTSIYATTASISATRQKYNDTEYLYEASWYVMPYRDEDLLFRVYLKKGNGKEYLAGSDGKDDSVWESAPRYSGASGYKADYYTAVFDKIVLEYKKEGSDPAITAPKTIEITIANKTG